MRSPVVIRSYPEGPRCWVAGVRVHHGATGCLLALALRRHHRLAAAALLLAAHDRADWRVWFKVSLLTKDLDELSRSL